jgi:hypothetical protein
MQNSTNALRPVFTGCSPTRPTSPPTSQQFQNQLNEVVERHKSSRKSEESQELIFSQALYNQYITPAKHWLFASAHLLVAPTLTPPRPAKLIPGRQAPRP